MTVCTTEKTSDRSIINDQLFEQMVRLIYDLSGIVIRDGKQAMLSARINKRIRALSLQNFEQYLQYIENDASGDEITQMLDMVSTNVTSFFREPHHFDLLADLVRDTAKQGVRQMRFWSAASSSGPEPYSMAITIDQLLGSTTTDWRILATDISTRMLERCHLGQYPENDLRSISADLRDKYFKPTGNHGVRQATTRLREKLTIARLNLSIPPFPMKGPMDAVFCRNVMIYFDQAVRERLVTEVRRLLRPGGLFCIGHAENLSAAASVGFVRIGPSAYQRTGT